MDVNCKICNCSYFHIYNNYRVHLHQNVNISLPFDKSISLYTINHEKNKPKMAYSRDAFIETREREREIRQRLKRD